ncbi:MAG: hypothetical protein WKH97_04115 [Casimicrobiaceae bacterium]
MNELTDLWHYETIAVQEPERAARLSAAPDWTDMILMVSDAFRTSLLNGATRFGFDESGRNASHLRTVMQFPVGEQLFDWFFNAQTGYRAQFRRGSEFGNVQNAALITVLRREFDACNLDEVSARRLSNTFDDLGSMNAEAQDVLTSLDPSLSKVWFCARRIGRHNGVEDRTVFQSTPDLLFWSGYPAWRSISADDLNAWLDVKGAFIGDNEVYQLKAPILRAQDLQSRGTA